MAKPLTVLERLELVEKKEEGLSQSFDLTLNQVRAGMSNSMEFNVALINVLEEANIVPEIAKKVQEKIDSNREKRAEAVVNQEKTQRETLIKMGVLKPTDKISETSLIIARMRDAKGEVIKPDFRSIEFNGLIESVRPAFLGQGVGFIFKPEDAVALEVLEIYEINTNQESSAKFEDLPSNMPDAVDVEAPPSDPKLAVIDAVAEPKSGV